MRWLTSLNIPFTRPGYPIYKASTVPFHIDNKFTTLYEVKTVDIENWRKAIEGLKKFLEAASEYIKLVATDPVKVFELLADMITLYFKLPLIEEPLPTISHSPLKLYLISRLMTASGISSEEWVDDLHKYATVSIAEFEKNDSFKKLFEIFDDDLNKAIKESWLFLPSDTRPGLNISSLLPHLLLTSSIAWCKAVNRSLSREECALLRLATLLHDIGKPFDYKEHYKVSREIAKYLTRELPIPKDYQDKIVEWVEKHHIESPAPSMYALTKADQTASAIDRVLEAVKKLIGEQIEQIATQLGLDPKDAYGAGVPSWEFWRKVGEEPELFKALCESFVTKLKDLSDEKLREVVGQGGVEDDLSLCCVDIGGVQEFIMRTRELRCVAASSMFVDDSTVAYIPLLLQMELERSYKVWLPFESFVYNLGGVILFIAPTELASHLEQNWDAIRRRLEGYFDLYLARTPLNTSYYQTSGRLASEMALRKITTQPLIYSVKRLLAKAQLRERCQKCYSEPPVTQTEYDEKFCKLCFELYKFGSGMHFAKRWGSRFRVGNLWIKPEDCFNIPYDKLTESFDIMYFIAGHNKDEIEGRKRNLALIKVDGNLMGAFFARSISIADAIEKSARVDLALKGAFEEATYRIFETISRFDEVAAKQTVASLKLGLLYMGGDDALIICPSWIALPLAVDISENFYKKMGGECSLSVGIVAAPPEHDIWALIDGSSKLLEEAKRVGRVKSSGGALCFDIVEGGILSGATVKGRYEDLKNLGLTAQPFTILKDDQIKRITIDEVLVSLGVSRGLGSLYGTAFWASRLNEKDNEEIKKLKRIREAVRNSVKVSEGFSNSSKMSVMLVFTQRMSKEGSEQEKEAYNALMQLFKIWFNVRESKIGFPTSDVDRVIKILGGGVI